MLAPDYIPLVPGLILGGFLWGVLAVLVYSDARRRR